MDITYDFKGKVAIITGGGSGIGWATAKSFANSGATVVILDRFNPEINTLVDVLKLDYKIDALFLTCDVSIESEVENCINQIMETFGRIDFAYNNAGIGGDFGKVENYPTSDWDYVMNVNLKGVFLCMKYEVRAMLKGGGGAIVNCASVLSTVCYENDAAYVASKFGVLGLTKNAALDYAASNIKINAISPGFTYTPMIMKGTSEKIKQLEMKHPAGRLARPDEIAQGVLWLCSTHSSFARGLNLLIDGGYTLL